MHLLRILLLCSFLAASHIALQAQCYGNPQFESQVCAYTPVTHGASNTCGNCTHTWSGSPISGQGTPIAQYATSGDGNGCSYIYPSVSSYNPNVPCSYTDLWQTTVGLRPTIPMPTLVNGPWNGDTAKTWIYARDWTQYPFQSVPGMGNLFWYNPTWTINGGVLKRHVTATFIVYGKYDTLEIKWNGNGPMAMSEARNVMYQGTWGNVFNCNWGAQSASPTWPTLTIFHAPSICVGLPSTMYTFPFPGSTFTWSVSNGSVVGGQGTSSAQLVLNGTSTITVLRDSSGIQTTSTTTVTPTVPSVNLGPDQLICQGTSVTLNAGSGASSYAWSTGATTQSIQVSAANQYRVTVYYAGGCSASDTINISTIPVVPPNLGPDLHPCTFPVVLDAGPGYVSYAWSNGATTQTISASTVGSYRVTATDANGCASSDTIAVFSGLPNLNLGADRGFCLPGPYSLSSSAFGATSILWSTGATSVSINVNTPGQTLYWCEATSTYGCVRRDTVLITGNTPPAPNIGPDVTICPNSSILLDAGPGYSSYLWRPMPYVTSQTRLVSSPGAYWVEVTDANGCTGSDTINVSNYPFATLNLGPDINVCNANAVLNAGPGYATYAWNTGANTQTITVSNSGAYSVTVTGAGGCTDSDTIFVTFGNVNMSLGPDQVVCEPTIVTLNPQLVGNFSYLWSNGATTATQTLTAPGTYLMTLAATNGFGCVARDTVTITIMPNLTTTLQNDSLLCADTSLVLDIGPGFTSYQWSTGATSQAITITSGGHFEITATNPNGCVRRDTINITSMVDCTFPGDADYNGVADMMDVLAIGTVYGDMGGARQNPSTAWYGQWTPNWAGNLGQGANSKQADTDGNGVVNANDTLAVQQNFGNTHTRIGTVATTGARLTVSPLSSAIAAGDTAFFGVYLSNVNGGDLDSLHGLTFTCNWPTAPLAGPGLLQFDQSAAWFAPQASSRLTMMRLGAGTAQFAISRTSGVDTSGQGMVGVLAFVTDPNYASSSLTQFMPTISGGKVVGVSLTPVGSSTVSHPITIVGSTAEVDPRIVAHVALWPVPAKDQLHVQVDGADPVCIRLVSVLGQVVRDLPGNGQGEYVIDVADLAAGTYCLQVSHQQGCLTKQLIISH